MVNPLCMFDMDDTLYDYVGQLRRDLARLQSPKESPLPENVFEDAPSWLKHRIELIKNQPRWWFNLPRFRLGWDVYEVAAKIGYSIEILTRGPRRNFDAWSEKAERALHDFGPDVAVNIVGETKRWTYARVLVDDYPPYAIDWLTHRPRGLVIMPAHDYNVGVKHPNIVRYDGTNLDRITEAMKIAFNRRPGEPLKAPE